MILTNNNYKTISNNIHVQELVARLLKKGDKLVASNLPKGQYVCSCDIGTVQRIKKA